MVAPVSDHKDAWQACEVGKSRSPVKIREKNLEIISKSPPAPVFPSSFKRLPEKHVAGFSALSDTSSSSSSSFSAAASTIRGERGGADEEARMNESEASYEMSEYRTGDEDSETDTDGNNMGKRKKKKKSPKWYKPWRYFTSSD